MSPTPPDVAPDESDESDESVDPVSALFASRSVTEHVVRGVLGLVLVVVSLAHAREQPWAMLGLVPAALLWRGCPTCWLMGLGATLAGRPRTCPAPTPR